MEKETKVVYYSDEVHEDFANNGIKTKIVNPNYKYINKNPFSIFFGNLLLIIVFPIAWVLAFCLYRPKIKNKKVFNSVKKKGYYIYSNHTLPLDPLVQPAFTNPLKKCYIAASADTFSINPIVSWLVKSFGGFPVPNTPEMYHNYVDFIKHVISKKRRVLMYPEAHIWPYCNFVRHYTNTSFKYPVMTNSPIITLTTCFIPNKPGKKPKVVIYADGPIYPNLDLKYDQAVEDLKVRAFETMEARAKKYSTCEYIKYVYKPKEETK